MIHAFMLVILLGGIEQRQNPMYFRNINEFVRLDGLVFNPTLTIPNDTSFSVTGILSTTTFTTNVGTSTVTHAYVGSGTVTEYLADLTFGSGYRNPVSVAVTDPVSYTHLTLPTNREV